MVRKHGNRISATILIVSLIVTCFSKVGLALTPHEREVALALAAMEDAVRRGQGGVGGINGHNQAQIAGRQQTVRALDESILGRLATVAATFRANESFNREVDRLKERLRDGQGRLINTNALMQRIQVLEDDARQREEEIIRLTGENEELTVQIGQLRQEVLLLKRQIATLERQLHQATEDNGTLRQTIAELNQ
ncbi:MAG: hypothetical protein LBL16_04700 [Endomicrobium sp.]|jgi:chromosome segregation ATPase|nr:hypothetical protein [Endomicrobium sp.]